MSAIIWKVTSKLSRLVKNTILYGTFHVHLLQLINMSLFQFGFSHVSMQQQPTQEDSGLGIVEYNSALSSVSDSCDPTTSSKRRRQRGTYTHYMPSDCAKIGKYALENGNLKAMRHFSARFPDIKESTIRNFKKAYKERLDCQRKQQNPKPVTDIPSNIESARHYYYKLMQS